MPAPRVVRTRVRVRGRVQGVWYRGATREKALSLGLSGSMLAIALYFLFVSAAVTPQGQAGALVIRADPVMALIEAPVTPPLGLGTGGSVPGGALIRAA